MDVYGYKGNLDSLLLVDDLWVINGEWQIEKRDGQFYCVSPKSTFRIDIQLLGSISYDGDYNSTLERFRNGEGFHVSAREEPLVEIAKEPELCKRKYYGIDCSCSKCNKR